VTLSLLPIDADFGHCGGECRFVERELKSRLRSGCFDRETKIQFSLMIEAAANP
jgi:hypothetical protein